MRLLPFFILIIALFFSQYVIAQRITPFTQNNGGGHAQSMEWSIGESVSIGYFINDKVKLNTGVLQPLSDVVTSISDFGPSIFGNQIIIGPNPTNGILYFKATFSSIGNLKLQLLDSKSQVLTNLFTETFTQTFNKNISLDQYPSGVYYLKVYFKSISAANKIGVYKIIKL